MAPRSSRPQAGCDVVLVVMPFGPLLQPSIGLSLLRASLGGRPARIEYLTLAFADLIGADLYQFVAVEVNSEWLLGDWIFAGVLYGERDAGHDDYLSGFEGRRDELLRARRLAATFVEACLDRVRRSSPRIVGFTNAFAQQTASLALARRLKHEMPETAVVFGGANCEGVMGREIVRQFPFVDAVVSGEGDRIFSQLARRLLAGETLTDLPGVYCRGNLATLDALPRIAPRVDDMDALPYPDYDEFFVQWEASEACRNLAPMVLFETSRGCWWGTAHHCTFCGLNGSTMTHRSKSPGRAFAELEYLADRYPGRFILAVDNILDLRYFDTLISDLARSPLRLDLFYALKANLRKEQLRALRDAGIVRIQPGIESLSDPVLRLMRKGETGLQNIQLLKWCRELGLRPNWNFLWGFPGEPIEEYERMARLVPLLTHLTPPQAARRIRLDRFSPNFELGAELGFEDVAPCPAYQAVYPLEPEALRNLAYHFAFRYRDGRDVESYTGPLSQELERWRGVHPQSELFFADRGSELWIWDLRPVAAEALTVLTGLDRNLYLACDGIRGIQRLGVEAAAAGEGPVSIDEVETRLQPLVERGLMIRQGDLLLSLAVPASGRL
ncbi:MAG TPA: RiPP maturation radical SAM C-methyltransferase [Thermoanaerobaculia bacterium]|jgi:ribosomal peptide maturation radical SAM protein 1|nr:RiPP maturation radical SAM C-methyltransferase [Thermoanaerobaculia bacterium]